MVRHLCLENKRLQMAGAVFPIERFAVITCSKRKEVLGKRLLVTGLLDSRDLIILVYLISVRCRGILHVFVLISLECDLTVMERGWI